MEDELVIPGSRVIYEDLSTLMPGAVPSLVLASTIIALNLHIYGHRLIEDPFLGAGNGQVNGMRVVHLAAQLFELGDHPAIGDMLRRFRKEDVQSTFGEVTSAALMAQAGFKIHAGKKTGTKGEDFDFTARSAHYNIACEVISLRIETPDERKLVNKLKPKLEQIRPDLPSVLFCVLNETLIQNCGDPEPLLESVFRNIAADEAAPNYLIFIYPFGGGRSTNRQFTAIYRHPCCPDSIPNIAKGLVDYNARWPLVEMGVERGSGAFFHYVRTLVAADQAGTR